MLHRLGTAESHELPCLTPRWVVRFLHARGNLLSTVVGPVPGHEPSSRENKPLACPFNNDEIGIGTLLADGQCRRILLRLVPFDGLVEAIKLDDYVTIA